MRTIIIPDLRFLHYDDIAHVWRNGEHAQFDTDAAYELFRALDEHLPEAVSEAIDLSTEEELVLDELPNYLSFRVNGTRIRLNWDQTLRALAYLRTAADAVDGGEDRLEPADWYAAGLPTEYIYLDEDDEYDEDEYDEDEYDDHTYPEDVVPDYRTYTGNNEGVAWPETPAATDPTTPATWPNENTFAGFTQPTP